MSSNRRRGVIAALEGGGGGGGLPAEYQEVEYLEGDGTGYDIPIYVPLTNLKMTAKVMAVGGNRDQNFFSNWASGMSNSDYFYYISGTGATGVFQYRVAGTFVQSSKTITPEVVFEAEVQMRSGSQSLFIDGTSVRTSTYTYSSTVSRGPFHFLGTGSSNHSRSYGHVCIYDDGNLWAELIPCYRKADGVIGNYEVLSQTFYPDTNERMTKGPDV